MRKLLQKLGSVCLLVVIFALLFRVGELSVNACNFLQDRLTELGIPQQN